MRGSQGEEKKEKKSSENFDKMIDKKEAKGWVATGIKITRHRGSKMHGG